MPYADPEAQREYQRQWIARRRTEWIEANGPCVDCGGTDDLEVDHADAAEKVTHRVWSWSEERREAELAKCVVRCADCHERKSNIARDRGFQPRLTTEQVAEIRERYAAGGVTLKALAADYGCGFQNISKIVRRENRRHA